MFTVIPHLENTLHGGHNSTALHVQLVTEIVQTTDFQYLKLVD